MAHAEGTCLPTLAREALIDDPDFLRDIVQGVLQRLLEAEMSEHVRAGPHERGEKALVLSLMGMYLEGVSTLRVKYITEALCGTSSCRSTVSSLVDILDADLAAWRERTRGEVAFPFALVDATYQHVRVAGQVVS